MTGRSLLSKVPTVEPTPRIVGYGTQADWHWDKLAECESGGRWDTVDAGSPALRRRPRHPAVDVARVRRDEFAPNAGLATREEQIIVGQRIYNTYGGSVDGQSWGLRPPDALAVRPIL